MKDDDDDRMLTSVCSLGCLRDGVTRDRPE